MPGFDFESYVVLDVPSPVADSVTAVRRQMGDAFRASLPVEITIAGSSGVGPFTPAQDIQAAFDALDAIAASTPCIRASFGPVIRFSGTDIFAFTLQDERPFHTLHDRIKNAGLRFAPSPYPFKPHCTLSGRSPVSDSEEGALLSPRITEPFTLTTLSVYGLLDGKVTRLHRAELAMT